MLMLLSLAIAAFLCALLLTPVCRVLALRVGAVDRPDNLRKIHRHPVPRLGGVVIVLAHLTAFGILMLWSPESRGDLVQHGGVIRQLLPVVLVFAVGLLDDLVGLQPWHKLLGEVTAALGVYLSGIQIAGISGVELPHWCSLPLTVLWLVACTNALNLIDGVDGLAAGVGLFAALTSLLVALMQGNYALAVAAVTLAGALLGFLRYNFNPASIFLGDCGSLTIGFLLGCYSIVWSHKAATAFGMIAPLIALAVPLFDVALSIARRFLRGQPIFSPDRGHIHHRLLALGFAPRDVALILYAVCGVAAVLSVLGSVLDHRIGGLIFLLFCLTSWLCVKRLNYIEFGVAQNLLLGGAFRRLVREEIGLRSLQHALQAAQTRRELWSALLEACSEMGFAHVEMHSGGILFEARIKQNEADCWKFAVALAPPDTLILSRGHQEQPSLTLTPFFRLLQTTLRAKLQSLPIETPEPAETAVSAVPAALPISFTMKPPQSATAG